MTEPIDPHSTPPHQPMPMGMLFERDDLRYQITATKERKVYYEFKPGNDYIREKFDTGELEQLFNHAAKMVPDDHDSNLDIAESSPSDEYINFMCDIETLGTAPGSVVFEIAIVQFDPLTGRTGAHHTIELSVAYQRSAGMTVDNSTVKWWFDQGRDIEKEQKEKNYPTANRQLRTLVGWIDEQAPQENNRRFWCRGANFDPVLLEPLFQIMGINTPWNYWQWRDIRSLQGLLEIYGCTVSKPKNTQHTAMDDCHAQIQQVAHLISLINILKKEDPTA